MGERYLDAVEADGSKPSVPTMAGVVVRIWRLLTSAIANHRASQPRVSVRVEINRDWIFHPRHLSKLVGCLF